LMSATNKMVRMSEPAGKQCVAVNEAVALLHDKWTILVLGALAHEKSLRYGELQRAVAGISQRMLTLTLKTLEENGLVKRTLSRAFHRASTTSSPEWGTPSSGRSGDCSTGRWRIALPWPRRAERTPRGRARRPAALDRVDARGTQRRGAPRCAARLRPAQARPQSFTIAGALRLRQQHRRRARRAAPALNACCARGYTYP
jgi:hypothetical protein